MNKHTPTPWHAVISRDGLPYIVDDRNGLSQLTIVESPKSHQDHETDAANCIHICRAVNSHDALLAACRQVLAALPDLRNHGQYQTDACCAILRSAIAQATGNESGKE